MKRAHQLELKIEREIQPDRNHQVGGRSFYFFDLDDNVLFLPTSIYAFHKETGAEHELNTGDYALYGADIGRKGPFRDYCLNLDDRVGSYRRFRDHPLAAGSLEPSGGRHSLKNPAQPFVEDMSRALELGDFQWKGPSWHCFYHAAFNGRPVSVITARGHSPETIRAGIRTLVESGFLPKEPNYLTIYPVSHPDVRIALGDSTGSWSIARLKREAIKHSVQEAMSKYGTSPHHRFGMSDDSPENLQFIEQAMAELKQDYPANSFYVIDTEGAQYVKREIFRDHILKTSFPSMTQMDLFNGAESSS